MINRKRDASLLPEVRAPDIEARKDAAMHFARQACLQMPKDDQFVDLDDDITH